MAIGDKRSEARVSVREQGSLKPNGVWYPCTVLNMSNHGFLIACAHKLSVGQGAEFKCELYPGQQLECKIEIKHVSAAGAGSRIVDIGPRAIRLCQLYLEEQYSNQLTKPRS